MENKMWYESRELWVAILQGVAGILAVIATQYPAAGWALIGKSVLDALLRISSSGAPIGGKIGALGRALMGKE